MLRTLLHKSTCKSICKKYSRKIAAIHLVYFQTKCPLKQIFKTTTLFKIIKEGNMKKVKNQLNIAPYKELYIPLLKFLWLLLFDHLHYSETDALLEYYYFQ